MSQIGAIVGPGDAIYTVWVDQGAGYVATPLTVTIPCDVTAVASFLGSFAPLAFTDRVVLRLNCPLGPALAFRASTIVTGTVP